MTLITMHDGKVVMRCGSVATEQECCCVMPCKISLELTGVPLIYSYGHQGLGGIGPLGIYFDNGDPIMACQQPPAYFAQAYFAGGPYPGYGQLVQPDGTVELDLIASDCSSWTYRGYMTRGVTISGGFAFTTLDCGGQADQEVQVIIERLPPDAPAYMQATIWLPSTYMFQNPESGLLFAAFLHAERLVGGEQAADFDPFVPPAGQCVLDQLAVIDGRRVEADCPVSLLDRTYPMQLMLTYTGKIYQPRNPGQVPPHTLPPNSCETSVGLVYISGINATLSYPT